MTLQCAWGHAYVGVVGVGLLVGENKGLGGLVLHVVTPVRLHEHVVYLLDLDGLGGIF